MDFNVLNVAPTKHILAQYTLIQFYKIFVKPAYLLVQKTRIIVKSKMILTIALNKCNFYLLCWKRSKHFSQSGHHVYVESYCLLSLLGPLLFIFIKTTLQHFAWNIVIHYCHLLYWYKIRGFHCIERSVKNPVRGIEKWYSGMVYI